jgi:thiamine pyrophosphate-dependent acetolactate synthase large subunit-like protein
VSEPPRRDDAGRTCWTAAQLAVAQLQREGTTVLFSLNGGHIASLYDACLDARLRIVDVRHEDAAVHMASAWSRLTQATGVACVTAGPGVTNAITAVAHADASATPLVLLAGKVPTRQFDLGALQDVDQLAILGPTTKSSARVLEGRRVPEYVRASFRMARSAPFGPAFLELPANVLRQTVECDRPERLTIAPGAPLRPRPDRAALDRAVALLEGAQRPVIVAGSGVQWSGAQAELRRFAEWLEAPVLTTSLARGVISAHHPLALPAARSWLLAHADVVVVVGTRFNYVLNYGRPPRMPAGAAIVQIDVAAQELGRNRPVDVALQADAAAVLAELLAAVRLAPRRRAWLDAARAEHAKARAALDRAAETNAMPIHPVRLCRDVKRRLPADTVLVLDGGDILSFARLMMSDVETTAFLDSSPFGTLGVGLPFANAGQLARPASRAVCLTGDGALGFHLMEFDTAVRHALPIVVVVSNNAAWGIEANGQRDEFGGDRVIGTMLRDARFDLVAQALGGYGERVTDPAGIGPAVDRALESGRPALIDVVTDVNCASPDLRRGLARVPDDQPLASFATPR